MLSPARPQRGLTLVELLITLAVLVVALSLSAPIVTQQLAGWRVRGAAQGIVDALGYARTEAIRRNTPVTFTLGAGTAGWSVTEAAGGSTLQSRSAGEAPGVATTTPSGAWTLTFRPNGLVNTSGNWLGRVTVSSAYSSESRRIDIFGGGLIRICDPAVTTSGDPRSCT